MSQPIAMTGNPKEDVTNIRKMLETMLQYGFIHEEKFENIDYLMGKWAITKDEYQNIYKEDAQEDIDINDNEEFFEWVIDADGSTFAIDKIIEEKLPLDFAKYAALMYRCLAFSEIFESEKDDEEKIKECEKFVNEWIEDNPDYMN
jgi:hypothetical protein